MNNNIFENRIKRDGKTCVPVWFMRQAGRYHSHYQAIKKNSDFMTMCKNPKLACEVTLGPIHDFKFDAAILFSDLLFPLEILGMGLNYLQGPPKLAFHLDHKENFQKLKITEPAEKYFAFQGEACKLLRKELPAQTSLIGFVGAPFTLYTYATEGAHNGNLVASKQGLINGLFDNFYNLLKAPLLTEMKIQADNGAEAIALFDTAAGELCQSDYHRYIIPKLADIISSFKKMCPNTKIIYYSKFTQIGHLKPLRDLPIDVLGVDWRCDLVEVFQNFADKFYIQGNIDPIWLHLPWKNLEANLIDYKKSLEDKIDMSKWIFGLGHGVTIETPEENVRGAVDWVHRSLRY